MVKMMKLTAATVATYAAVASAKTQGDVKASEEKFAELIKDFPKVATEWRAEFMRKSPQLEDLKERYAQQVKDGALSQENMDVLVKSEEDKIEKGMSKIKKEISVKSMEQFIKASGHKQTDIFFGLGKEKLQPMINKMLGEAYKSGEHVASKETTDKALKQVETLFNSHVQKDGKSQWGMVADEAYLFREGQLGEAYKNKAARLQHWTKLVESKSQLTKEINDLRAKLRDASVDFQKKSETRVDEKKARDEALEKEQKKQLKKIENDDKWEKNSDEEKKAEANKRAENIVEQGKFGKAYAVANKTHADAAQKKVDLAKKAKEQAKKIVTSFFEEQKGATKDYCYHFGACANSAVTDLVKVKSEELFQVAEDKSDEKLKTAYLVNGDKTDNDVKAKEEDAERVANWAKDLTKAIKESPLGQAKEELEKEKKALFRDFEKMLEEKQVKPIRNLVKEIGGMEEPAAPVTPVTPVVDPSVDPVTPVPTPAVEDSSWPVWAIALIVVAVLAVAAIAGLVIYRSCARQGEELDDL